MYHEESSHTTGFCLLSANMFIVIVYVFLRTSLQAQFYEEKTLHGIVLVSWFAKNAQHKIRPVKAGMSSNMRHNQTVMQLQGSNMRKTAMQL